MPDIILGQLKFEYATQPVALKLKASLHPEDHFLEVLSQMLEKVFQLANEKSSQLPTHLVVVADNTVAGVKNTFGLRFLAYLVAQNLFRSTTLFSLMVGHTHEETG